jgi:hypothetical protein
MPAEKLSPLQIALQEYAYWRDCETPGDPNPTFETIQIGAIGAAANIIGRLSGANLEGITYRTLTPDQITRALVELKLAPRMAILIATIELAVSQGPEELCGSTMDELSAVMNELRKAGAQ